MKRVLVTGGSGLVGQAIREITCDLTSYSFYFASSKDADLTDYGSTKRLFEEQKPEYVIHLAANVGGLFKNMKYKVDMLEKNLSINSNVLRCAHEVGVQRLVACLSTCIFPDRVTYPIREEQLHDGPPHFSNDAYAYAKRILEVQCKAYREQYGDRFFCIIPTNIYGKYDNFHLEDSHVIPGLIHKCYLAKQAGQPFIVSGSGKPLRQFIYSKDLAILILWALENFKGDNLILGVPESHEISIGDLARYIAKEFDYLDHIQFDTTKPDGQYKKTVSVDILLDLIGSFEYTPISQGISETVAWFIENYEKGTIRT